MAYSAVAHLDYPQLATAAMGNALIANLEAVRQRTVDYGSGSDKHVMPVSYTFPTTAAVWLPSSAGGFYLNLRPLNYPTHTQFLVGFTGYASLGNVSTRRVAFGLIANGTLGSVSTPPLDLAVADGLQSTTPIITPINIVNVVTHDPLAPAGYLYLYIAAYNRDGVSTYTLTGDLWYKEL